MVRIVILGPEPSSSVHGAILTDGPEWLVKDAYISQLTIFNKFGIDAQIFDRSDNNKGDFQFSDQDRVLFIRYDTVLTQNLLTRVLQAPSYPVAFITAKLTISRTADDVTVIDGVLISNLAQQNQYANAEHQFCGILGVLGSAAAELVLRMQTQRDILFRQLLDDLCKCGTVLAAEYPAPQAMSQVILGGGSHARSKLVTRFRKEAELLGRRKLLDEIAYLKRLPRDVKALFPEVYSAGRTADGVYMEQEWLPGETLRDALFSGRLSGEAAFETVKNIVKTVALVAYRQDPIPAPESYVAKVHFTRFWQRIRQTLQRAPSLGPLLNARRLTINGREYKNVQGIVASLQSSTKLLKLFQPDYIYPHGHGDLHFENIILLPNASGFKLVDPRGFDYCDIHYDLGKICHSVHGKYDFLHKDLFNISWTNYKGNVTADFEVFRSQIFDLYSDLDQRLRDVYLEINNDKRAVDLVLFSEAMHFCAMMPFHLRGDGLERRAAALYVTGTLLLNDLLSRMGLVDLLDVWDDVAVADENQEVLN